MKKDTIPVAVGALILGFVLGIAFPQLFPDKASHTQDATHSEDDGHDHSQQQKPEKMTEEQINHVIMQ